MTYTQANLAAYLQRMRLCCACEGFNGNVCEIAFPRGACIGRWQTFLQDPLGRCPRVKPRWVQMPGAEVGGPDRRAECEPRDGDSTPSVTVKAIPS